jgi:GNAT superfamily N-acetyltransferase
VVIDRYRREDRRALDALYRRVFGPDAAEGSRLRWDWQYRRNPNAPPDGPVIWIAREGPTIVGQYATMPVRVAIKGREIDGSWGMDVMVAPERQRRGVGEELFLTWDRHTGASLGFGLSEASYRLFLKLKWPDVGPTPCMVKPLTRRALRQPTWPNWANRIVSAATYPLVRLNARSRRPDGDITLVRTFDDGFTRLWERIAGKFDFAVRRDAAYLNWKFIEPPHVRYNAAVLRREGDPVGYVVYRHLREPRFRVTLVVDFLTDPDDRPALVSLLRWIDAEARAADSDKIRCFVQHRGFRRTLRSLGYFPVKSSVEFTAKINGMEVGPSYYADTSRWHVTIGDSDQDR